MMATKGRFAEAYSTGNHLNIESDGSDISPRMDMVTAYDDSVKCFGDGFEVPVQVFSLSKLSSYEKKNLAVRLESELEKIRAFEKKYALLGSNNGVVSHVQRPSQGMKSKKSSGGSRSGKKPGSVANNKGRGGAWNRTSSGRFTATGGSASSSSVQVMKLCGNVMRRLSSHRLNSVFKDPVDIEGLGLTDYLDVIKQPMDFGTIKGKLASGKYQSPEEFCADVRLVFSNCMIYNGKGNQFYGYAQTMSEYFEKLWKDVEKKISKESFSMLPEKSRYHEEVMDVATTPAPAKKRKLSPLQPVVMPESIRIMTQEEKSRLRETLSKLAEDGELTDKIGDFLSENATGDKAGDDEIEIDVDTLSEDAWFTLGKLLDELAQENKKQSEKSEPCEIELRNEYGLSSSSMQADKGNEVVDEDIDIGVDEPPVSSYPTLEIERDTDMINDKETDMDVSIPFDGGVAPGIAVEPTLDDSDAALVVHEKDCVKDLTEGNKSASGVDQILQSSQEKPNSAESESQIDGESVPAAIQVSPEKLYRAAVLKNRFADTILKAREKTLGPLEKGDPEKLRREMEELELQKKKEKARLQAEAKAAEDAKRRVEEAAAAEVRRKRELEREAARQELLKMEKTVEINENSRFFDDLNMLRSGPVEQLPSAAEDDSIPDGLLEGGFGSFKFEGDNALEQLGLYRKVDDEEEEEEQHNALEQLGLYRKDDGDEEDEEEGQHNNPTPPPSDMIVDDEGEEGQLNSPAPPPSDMKANDEEEAGQHNSSAPPSSDMKADDEGEDGQHNNGTPPPSDMKADDEEEDVQHNSPVPPNNDMKVDGEGEEGQHNSPAPPPSDMKVNDEGEEGQHNSPAPPPSDMKTDNEEVEGQHSSPAPPPSGMKVDDGEEEGQHNSPTPPPGDMKVYDGKEEGQRSSPAPPPSDMKAGDEEEKGQHSNPTPLPSDMKADDEKEEVQYNSPAPPPSGMEVDVEGEEEQHSSLAPPPGDMKVDGEEEEGQHNSPVPPPGDIKVDGEEEEGQHNSPVPPPGDMKVDGEGEEGQHNSPTPPPGDMKVDGKEEEGQHSSPAPPPGDMKVDGEEEPASPPGDMKVDGEEEEGQHNSPAPPSSVNKEVNVEEGEIN